ncbi:hypothetical protein Pcinc_036688 [Petrolisthes cinctipes]|uniref:Reverse transcriptase domain-containing protein n=1 Tax=Petrolisthes cinctipes TaxID=88211 RepID=A0AAE1BU52_PETCI|nr:hypothetical protein Pcinc_036688 [Petrolisthes cinctipes]
MIKGYSSWVRKDRSTLGGGVALCFKNSLRVVVLDTPIPADLEVIIWKVYGDKDIGILCVGCYRHPSPGTALIDYLLTNLDRLMTDHHCNFVIILGDLNQRGIQHSFDSLLAVFNLQNYVTFPTHRSGSSIDPVVTDLPSHEIQCSSMGPWESADWCKLQNSLEQTDWESVLQGDVDQQVEQFTETLLSVQNRWVPHKQHRTKATDQPWFGPQCCTASNDKYRAWRRYKRHPTRHNRTLLRAATARLVTTQAWAREQWEECLRRKLRGGNVGSKQWWGLVKDAQGEAHESSIPPLIQTDGTTVHLTKDKVDLLAQHFARKMTVPDPTRAPPSLPVVAGGRLTSFSCLRRRFEPPFLRWRRVRQWALTGAKAYADDVTVSVSFAPGDETSTISRLNTILHRLEIWGQRWQVSFAPHKTQLLVVSRTRHDIRLFFDGAFLTPSRELKILGVTYDDKLTFKPHIMQLARTAAGQLASLRRISWLLDNRGRELLYKAQIRSSLEYSCLAWGGAAPSHIVVLDKVQRRAERIIWDGQ